MKLHLPTGLRKALLVCLAAVALPAATIPTTVASASGIAAAFLIASQRAAAEGLSLGTKEVEGQETVDSITVDNDEAGSISGGVKIGNDESLTVTGTLSGTLQKSLRISSGVNNQSSTGKVYLRSGGTMDGNMNVFDGITICIGNGQTLSVAALGGNGGVFNADGEGATLKVTGTAEQEGQKQTIEGNVAVELDSNAVQVLQESTIKGKLTLGGGSVLKAYKSLQWSEDWLQLDGLLEGTGTIQVGGAGANGYTGGKLIWKGTTNSATAKLKFDGTATLELHNNLSVSALSFAEGAQSATIARGSDVGETVTLSLGTITVNSAGSGITIGIDGGVLLDFSDIAKSGEGKLTINLTEYTDQTEFQLFESSLFGTWLSSHQEDWSDYIDFQGLDIGKKASLDTSRAGYVTVSTTSKSYTYGGTSDLTWQVGQDSGWTTGGAWEQGGIVQFTASSGVHTVTLGGEVTADQLEITQAGATYNFTGNHTLTLGEFKARGDTVVNVSFAEGTNVHVTRDMTFEAQGRNELTFGERLIVDGKVTVWGGGGGVAVGESAAQLTLKKGGTFGELDVSWRTNLLLGDDVVLEQGFAFNNSAHAAVFSRTQDAVDAQKDVYVVMENSSSFNSDGANSHFQFTDVGFKVRGSKHSITLSGPNWNIGGNLAAEDEGALSTTQGMNFTVTGKLIVDTTGTIDLQGSTVTVGGASVANKGDAGLKLRDGASLTLTEELSGEGQVTHWGKTLTLKKGGKIGSISMAWGTAGETMELVLGADLELNTFVSPGFNATMANINRDAEISESTVYVLFNIGDEASQSLADFYKRLKFNEEKVVIGDGVGIGKTGSEKLTITDEGTLECSLKIKEGDMEFQGAVTFNKDIVLAGGNAVFNASGNAVTGKLEGASGSLTLGNSASLSLNGGINGSLTNLTLGASAVLDVKSGTLNLTGNLSFETESKIKLNESGQKITLTSSALQGISDKTLAIELTSAFMGDSASNSIQLFTYWDEAWDKLFTFSVEGDSGVAYKGLHVDSGMLVWGDEPMPGGDMTWSGAGTAVTLGDSISGDGWSATGAVDDTKTVTLEGSAAAVAVDVDGGDDNVVTMKSLTVGNAGGSATTYTFSAASDQTLKVSEGVTINDSSVFGEHVVVDATGSTVAVNGGITKFENGSTLTAGKLTISGQGTVVELHSAADSVNVQGTLANDVSGGNVVGVNGDGGIEIEDGATLRLTSDVFSDLAYAKGLGTVDIAIGGSPTGKWDNWFGNLFPAVAYDGAELTLRLSSSTNLILDGNLGDRLQNAKKVDIENGSSVIVNAKGSGGQDLFNVGTDHELHIEGSGADGAGALVIGQAETISWAFVLDGAATVTNTAAMMLTGELDTGSDGKALTKKGNGTLEFGDSFSTKAGSSGTVAVEEGTLKLSNTTNANALQNHTIVLTSGSTLESGITGTVKALTGTGTLNVTDGELTLTDATSSTLTSLQLAAGAKLTVSKGNFAITSALTWGKGSVLKLGAKLTIDLTGVSSLTAPEGAHKLKIDLASDALDQNNSYQLFRGWREDWNSADLFDFTIDGQAVDTNTYADLRLNSEGKLEWGGSSPAPEELTWYTPGEGNTWGTSGTGWGEEGTAAWNNQGQTTAVFNDTTGEEVTISGALKAAVVQVKGGGQMWGFKVGRDDSLTVNETLNVGDSTKLAISGEGGVDVKGGVALGVGSSILLKEGSRLTTGKTWTFGSNSGVQMESDSTLVYTFSDSENFLSLVKTLSTTADATGAMLELAGTEDVSVTVNENITFATGLKKTEGGITLTALEAGQSITIGGEIDVKSLSWIGAEGGSPNNLTLKKGGRIHGNLLLTLYGTLILGGDLVVGGEIQSGAYAENVVGTGNEYLLVERSGEMPWNTFLSSYTNRVTLGGVGMGKAGVEELIINDEATLENNFKVSEGTVTFRGTVTITDKKLALSDGATVNFNGGIAASLTALTLGSHAKMSIASGETLTLRGGFTWGQGAILDLGSKLTIALDGGSLIKPGAQDLLTIDLSADVLSAAGSGNWQLFSGWNEIAQWSQYIDFTVDGSPVNSEVFRELKLNESGYLTWASSLLAGGYIYDGSKDLIWDDSTSTNTGWQTDQAYENNASVQFTANEGTHAVKVGSDVVAGSLRVTGRAKYNVTSSADGAAHLLIVKNKMELVAGSELSFSKDVQLQLDGTASLAEGSKLAVSSNINLGDTGRFDGTGNIEKGVDVNQVYVQFQVDQDRSSDKDFGQWFADRLGGVELGAGVGFQKTGTGKLTFDKRAGTLDKALDIAAGSLSLNGASYTLSEQLTGTGKLIVVTGGLGTVTLSKGANMTGDLALSCYATSLALGANTTFGGLVNEGSDFSMLGNREHLIKKIDGGNDVTLTLKVTGGEQKEAQAVNVGNGVKIVKDGDGTQKFAEVGDTENGRVTLAGGVEVKQGVLEIEGDHSTISGALSGNATEGTLRLASGNLTISGGGKHGGTLELTAGTITISGATLEVGTFKATEGKLDVRSNLTIGYGANEGLSTLKIASGTKVTLKGGTLKAESLDLTGTQGASLSIDMTGQAKLDFGGITLGTDGKLAIELTGDNGDMGGYQLFEISSFGSVWDALVTDDKTWEDVFDITVNGENDKVLGLNREGWLDMETTGMEWNGGGTWSDTSGSQWEGGKTPNGEDVRFTEQGAQKDETVQIEGKVAPRNVYVDGGEYTFTQQGGTEGGLNMSSDDGGGVLRVRDAKLTLKLKNTAIPEIQLKDQGTLVLAHDGALPGDSKIKFQGGVLEYSNAPLANSDVSRQIASAGEGSEAVVKVSVDGTTYTNGVTWGSASTAVGDNSGLNLALNEKGIEKSGAGDFTLAWRGTGDTHEGSIAVNEGSLTLNVSNATTLSGTISGSGTLKITGGEVTLSGGNNTVANIQVDSGATLKAGRANALGGADTTLTLNGGNLSGNNVIVNAGQVKVMEATTLSGVTLAGTVTGEEAMSAGSGTAGLSGDISGYTGELTGTGTWKLSGKALEKPVTNAVSGSGIVSFAGESVYGGDVKGSVTLEGGGENGEQLVITSRTTSNGAKLKGQVTLGNQEEQAVWQGSTLVNGEITLANVELAGGIRTKRNAKLYVSTATSGVSVAAAYEARAARRTAEVNVNGMSGEQLDGITINEHGRLTGITGSYTADANHKLELHFAGENVGESATVGEGENALIAGEGSDFSLNAESKDNVELWLSSDAVASIIGKLSEADGENGEMADAYLHLLQGGDLTIGEVTLSDLKGSDAELLERLDVTEVRVEGGSVRLVGTAADVFVVNETSTLTDAAALGTSKSTVLSTPGVELTLNLDGGTADDPEDNRAIVNNLLGVTGSQLHLQNSSQDDPTGANRLEVTFHNAKVSVNDKDKYPSVDDTTVEGQHTTFNGSIDGGEGVDVKKTGFGTLSVGGDYTLEDGTTTITAGALKLRGAKNTINGLAFDYADVQQQKDKGEDYRGLLLDGGRTTVRGSITEGEKKTGEIVMSSGAELVLNGESDLEGTSITGDDSTKLTLAVKGEQRASLKLRGGKNVSLGEDGKRTVLSGVDVEVQEGASMEVSGIDAAMKGSDLTVQRGELKLTEGATMTGGSATLGSSNSLLDLGSSAQNSLTALNGTGTLKSAAGGNTTITGEAGPSVFSGKLASTVEGAGAGKLTISRNAEVTLDNVDTSAAGGNTANAWDVEVQDGGRLTLDVSKSNIGEEVVLGDVNFGSGNTVNLKVNSSNYNLEGSTVKGNTLSFGENTMVMLEAAAGDVWDGGRKLTLGEWGAVKGGGEDIDVQLRGDGFIFADVKGVVVEGRTVIVQLEGAKENKFERAMPNGEKNAMAGATMVWGSLKDKSELDSFVDMLTNSESDYARVIHGLVTQMDNGQTGSLQNALASVAGSSVATIGPAVMEDLHRQIKTIRNRTTTMATEATYDNYDQLPLWHAWINGEGGYHKMDADSQAPGYTLNNWGGTVGVDVDMSPQATMGLAITAMYGNLKPESVDAATGNVDMTYLSGFVRATGGAWIHTFVMSGGKADVQLDRTVSYGTGSYRTRGSTDGYVLGAMYEVGYTRLFSTSGTFALQPVFNVEARHASIKGYTETGSDAGLHVDEISQDVVTFGLGARMQSLVGENSFNRTAIFEARLLLKADVGDRSGTADNTLLGAVTRAEVESAEVGAIGVEVGAGLTIPLGSSSGSIFMDASVECRRGWTSLDASAGYRISF